MNKKEVIKCPKCQETEKLRVQNERESHRYSIYQIICNKCGHTFRKEEVKPISSLSFEKEMEEAANYWLPNCG